MKTLNDVYDEVVSSDENREKFLALKSPEEVVEFVKSFGVDASIDEIRALFAEKKSSAGELTGDVSEEDLRQVAGGKSASWMEALQSVGTLGFNCAVFAIVSANSGNWGSDIEGEGMLCDTLPTEEDIF